MFEHSHVAELKDGRIREFEVEPGQYGLGASNRDGISGGAPQDSASRGAQSQSSP